MIRNMDQFVSMVSAAASTPGKYKFMEKENDHFRYGSFRGAAWRADDREEPGVNMWMVDFEAGRAEYETVMDQAVHFAVHAPFCLELHAPFPKQQHNLWIALASEKGVQSWAESFELHNPGRLRTETTVVCLGDDWQSCNIEEVKEAGELIEECAHKVMTPTAYAVDEEKEKDQ